MVHAPGADMPFLFDQNANSYGDSHMNSTLKNLFAGVGILCAVVAACYGLSAIYGAIYNSGVEDRTVETKEEIGKLKSELAQKTADATKATQEKEDALAKLGDAEQAKKDSDVARTLADTQHRAFVAVIVAVRRVNENSSDYIQAGLFKGSKPRLMATWLSNVTFSQTGVQIGKQSFDYVRNAAGDVTDITFKVTAPTTAFNNNYR